MWKEERGEVEGEEEEVKVDMKSVVDRSVRDVVSREV